MFTSSSFSSSSSAFAKSAAAGTAWLVLMAVAMAPSSSMLSGVAAAAASSSGTPIMIGDTCGVDGSKVLANNFTGDYRVAGAPGCSIDLQTDCYCSPKLGDTDQVGVWIWQCNSQSVDAADPLVPFGPAINKTCPVDIPVPPGYTNSVKPYCDYGTNPTGQAGNPSCGYSNCERGGDFSAVCGCLDLTFGEGKEPSDFQWRCLYSTCSCGAATAASSSSTAPLRPASVSFGGMVVALVTMSILASALGAW
jgi:hypothetical protein